MKTVVLRQPGGPDVLEIVEGPMPVPGPGEVVIRSRAIGVSRPDILIREGRYSWMPPLPASPGSELSGVIDAIGSGVSSFQVGQAVLVSARDLPVRGGCYTEAICVPAGAAYALPAGVDFDQAVVLPTYLVAYAMLEMFESPERLKSIFVTGVAGGIGGAIAELAKDRGLMVIGSVGSAEREAYARKAGVDHIVNYREEDVVARILALTGGRGVDAAFDHIVGPNFAALFSSLADFGTLVFYNVHNQPPDADVFEEMSRLSTKSLALRCFNIHTYDHHRDKRQQMTRSLIDLLAQRRINPRVGLRLPLSEAATAQTLLEQGSVSGKIVLYP
jgi:NADPH2:quinone reductase